jgi:hypothetical protein
MVGIFVETNNNRADDEINSMTDVYMYFNRDDTESVKYEQEAKQKHI